MSSTRCWRQARSPACARTRSSTRSWPRSARRGARAREPHRREHRDRARLDGRLPGRPDPLSEHARRAAVRPLRRGELPRLRRARPARVLRAAAHRRRAADHLAADAAGLPVHLQRARRLRADLLAAHLLETVGHVPERLAGGRRDRRRPGAADRHGVGLGRHRDARDRDPGAARAGDDRRGDRAARRATTASGESFSSRSTRSSSSSRAAGSAEPGRSPATSSTSSRS